MNSHFNSGQKLALRIGTTTSTNAPLLMSLEALLTHLYICGATRVGKSKEVEHICRELIRTWTHHRRGLLLIDGHGNLCQSLLKWLAWNYPVMDRPVVVIDFSRPQWLPNYNVLRPRQANPSVAVASIVAAMAHASGKADTLETPLFADCASIVMGTLMDLKLTLSDAGYFVDYANKTWRDAMTSRLSHQELRQQWSAVSSYRPIEFEAKFGSTARRLRPFRQNDILRAFFGLGDGPAFDFRRALDEGWIVLVNLSSEGGHISHEDASVIGAVLLHDAWSAAEERGKDKGRPFHIVCDEFQRYLSPALAESMDQAAGFGLRLILSHQYPTQLLNRGPQGKAIYDSVMQNARTKMVFSTEQPEDLPVLTDWLYRHEIDPDEVKREFRSRKVLDYEEEWRPSFSNSLTDSTTMSGGLTLCDASSIGTGVGLGGQFARSAGKGQALSRNQGSVVGFGSSGGGGVALSTPGDVTLDPTCIDSSFTGWSDVQAFCSSEGLSINEFLSWAVGVSGNLSFSSSESRAEARSLAKAIAQARSRGVTVGSRLRPVLGEEVSSIQWRGLDEQRHRFMQVLAGLQQRQAVVRLVGTREPVPFVAPFVQETDASDRLVDLYLQVQRRRWPFMLSRHQAQQRLAERQAELSSRFLTTSDECTTSRRRVTVPHKKP